MDNDDEKFDIALEAAPTLGAEEDKYEATLGKPYADVSEDKPAIPGEGVKIPPEAMDAASGNAGVLLAILCVALFLVAAAVSACLGSYIAAAALAGVFVICVCALFAVSSLRERQALSGKNVLGKDGTVLVKARVKRCELHSKKERVLRAYGQVYKRETVSAVYKVVLSADGKEFTALSNVYYKQNASVYAYVNGNKAFIEADAEKIKEVKND